MGKYNFILCLIAVFVLLMVFYSKTTTISNVSNIPKSDKIKRIHYRKYNLFLAKKKKQGGSGGISSEEINSKLWRLYGKIYKTDSGLRLRTTELYITDFERSVD